MSVDLVLCGVGYHHAGMDVDDRKLVEKMFSQSYLAVLGPYRPTYLPYLVSPPDRFPGVGS